MKTKLLLWETATILVALGLFLIIFSIQNGWELIGIARYSAAADAVAVILTVIAVIAANAAADSILAATAGAIVIVAAITVAISTAAGVAVTGVAVVLIIAVLAIVIIINGNYKKLKSFFAISSLIVEVLVVFGTISAITFLL